MKRLLFIVPLLALAVSCASLTNFIQRHDVRHLATVGAKTADVTLSGLQDLADAFECGKPTAPPACIPTDIRNQKIAPKLSLAFDYDKRAAQIIRSTPPGLIPDVAPLYADITKLAQDVINLIPKSPETDAAIGKLTAAVEKGGQ